MSQELSIVYKSEKDTILTNVNLGKLCTFMIVYASFYYPLGAFFIIQLGVPSTPVNIGFRSLAAITAAFLIFCYLLNPYKHLKLNKSLWLLLIWWVYYSSRIIFDLARGIKFSGYGNEFIYGITFGNILLPIIAIVLWREYIDLKLFKKIFFWFILTSCILILITIVQQTQRLNLDIFLQRLDLVNNKGRARESSVLNPIAIGFYGEILLILSLFRMLFEKRSMIIYNLLGIVLGFLLLLFGASRGPFLSCGLIIGITFFIRFAASRSKVVLLLKYVFIAILASVILLTTILKNVQVRDFAMFIRITKFFEDRQANKTEARDFNIASAWQDFLDSPLLGKQFVGTYDNFYPHNVFVEVFMATGLVGALLFFPLLLIALKNTFTFLRQSSHDLKFVAIVFLPCFFFMFTSGCLFQSVDFWLLLTTIVISPYVTKKQLIN